MEKDNYSNEIILTLYKQNKKIFKTALPGSDVIELVFNLLVEQKKISSSDILVDKDGTELDLKRFKIKHLEGGILCLKSDFPDSDEVSQIKASDPHLKSVQDSAEKKDEYKFYTKSSNPECIVWSDIQQEDQLTLIQNLCKFGYHEKKKNEFTFAEDLWDIKSFSVEILNQSSDEKYGVWVPKIIVNVELCNKGMSSSLREFLNRKNATLENIDSKDFYETFGTIAPMKIVLGAINMSLILDEDKWKDEYNNSNLCEIFSCGITNLDDDTSEFHYNWAVIKILETQDSLFHIKKLYNNDSNKLKQHNILQENKEKKVAKATSNLEALRNKYGNQPFDVFYEGNRQNGRGAISVSNGIYEGEFRDGKYHGKGAFLWKSGNIYEGEYFKGKMDGKGIYYFASGNRYEGDFKDDMFHGFGIHFWTSGNRYEGEYRNDKKNGKGTYYYASGNKYIGDFKNDLSDGWGIFYWTSGNRYEGEYRNDKKNGRGVYYFASGNKYEGEFKDNLSHGKGIFTWKSGNRYVGDYANDKKNGYGTYYFASGNKYEGQFKDDVSHGKGTYYWSNGNRYEGEYKNDKKDGYGVYYFANGSKYEGEFKDGFYDGKGTYTWKNGDKYVGEYKDDKKHGKGVFTKAGGEVIDQVWDYDQLISENPRK